MNARGDAALALARREFVAGVFPLRVNSKHEHKRGHEADRSHATRDAATLAAMWAAQPRANIGYLVAPGYVVVENDPRNGGTLAADKSTYCEHTASGPDSLHLPYRLPDGVNFAGTFAARPGVEIHGAGQRMTGAGSTINGKAYAVVNDCDAALAPQWVIEAIREHEAARLAKAAMRATSTATQPPTQPIDDERGKRWADASLLYISADLHEAAQGARNDAIRRNAFKAGQLAAYLDISVIEAHMLAACSQFDNQRKVEATIRKQIAAGALHPRHPMERTDRTGTRRALAAMVAMLDESAGRWGEKWTCSGSGNIRTRGATVRAGLTAILEQASKANTFDVRMSERHLAELAQCGRATSWKVLHALIQADMLELVDDKNKQVEGQPGLFEGNQYRLTAAGFLALQRAEFSPVTRPSISQHEGEVGGGGKTSSSCWPLVGTVTGLTETDAARHLGVFGHFQLGRAAYVVARALAVHGPLTSAQIVTVTGLPKQTVSRVLARLAEHGLVDRGARREASALSPDFHANATAVAENMSTQARAGKRAERHIRERGQWRAKIAARKAEREAQAQAQDVQPDELAVIEVAPVALATVERASFKAKPALDALRYQREARQWWAAHDAQTAHGMVHP